MIAPLLLTVLGKMWDPKRAALVFLTMSRVRPSIDPRSQWRRLRALPQLLRVRSMSDVLQCAAIKTRRFERVYSNA